MEDLDAASQPPTFGSDDSSVSFVLIDPSCNSGETEKRPVGKTPSLQHLLIENTEIKELANVIKVLQSKNRILEEAVNENHMVIEQYMMEADKVDGELQGLRDEVLEMEIVKRNLQQELEEMRGQESQDTAVDVAELLLQNAELQVQLTTLNPGHCVTASPQLPDVANSIPTLNLGPRFGENASSETKSPSDEVRSQQIAMLQQQGEVNSMRLELDLARSRLADSQEQVKVAVQKQADALAKCSEVEEKFSSARNEVTRLTQENTYLTQVKSDLMKAIEETRRSPEESFSMVAPVPVQDPRQEEASAELLREENADLQQKLEESRKNFDLLQLGYEDLMKAMKDCPSCRRSKISEPEEQRSGMQDPEEPAPGNDADWAPISHNDSSDNRCPICNNVYEDTEDRNVHVLSCLGETNIPNFV